MDAARGIVTAPRRHDQPRRGPWWRAAWDGLGVSCVGGEIHIDAKAGEMRARGKVFRAGDIITIAGSTGEVLSGVVKMTRSKPELSGDFATLDGMGMTALRRLEGARQRRDRRRRQNGASVRSAEWHRPLPHRTHVL